MGSLPERGKGGKERKEGKVQTLSRETRTTLRSWYFMRGLTIDFAASLLLKIDARSRPAEQVFLQKTKIISNSFS
jgi:hypothetical protein